MITWRRQTMATPQPTTIQIKGFGKKKMQALAERARELGMTPERYLRHLVEEDLAISERAKTTRFEVLWGPGQPVDEAEIDRLVENARNRRFQRKSRKVK